MNTNVKRSSRLAAKELNREENENDSRKRGRDRDDYVSTYKRPVPSTKKSPQVAACATASDSGAVASPARPKEKVGISSPVVATGKLEQTSYSPSAVVEGASAFRVGHGEGLNCSGLSGDFESKDSAPAQRPPPNNVHVPKAKEAPKPVRGGILQSKPISKVSTAAPPPQAVTANAKAPVRLPTKLPSQANQAEANRDPHQVLRIGQQELKGTGSRPDIPDSLGVPQSRPLNEGIAPTALSGKEMQKPGRERNRTVGMNGTSSGANFMGVPPAVNENLRRSLGGAVERWISARSALPGGEAEDLCGFRPEIERLVKLIAFEAHESKCEIDDDEGSNGDDSEYEKQCSREITTTRFRLAHPQMKLPFVFESTQHIFTGSVLGAGGMGHRLEGLQWKVEFELIGFFVLAFHTQTYQVDEDVELPRLDEVREALQTHITSSELGVLFMLAGNASRGPAAWKYVEDVCFWTANFSLPEFPGP